MMREKRPRGGVTEAAYSKRLFSLASRIRTNTNKGCVLAHPLFKIRFIQISPGLSFSAKPIPCDTGFLRCSGAH
jgi:hypothetical protein